MRQTELHLTEDDRAMINGIRMKGLHQAREVNRAHVLASLDQGVPEAQIMAVLGIGRTAVWRTRAAYLQGGVDLAVFDVARSGRPPANLRQLDEILVTKGRRGDRTAGPELDDHARPDGV